MHSKAACFAQSPAIAFEAEKIMPSGEYPDCSEARTDYSYTFDVSKHGVICSVEKFLAPSETK